MLLRWLERMNSSIRTQRNRELRIERLRDRIKAAWEGEGEGDNGLAVSDDPLMAPPTKSRSV